MHRADKEQNGYSLIELTLVCAMATVILAGAVPIFQTYTRSSNADSAAQVIVQELSLARALAISTHAPILVQIDPAANSVSAASGTGSVRGPFLLPGEIRFMSSAPALDTPDGLGGTLLGTGPNTNVTFLDNGAAATDTSGATLCSGTFFLEHQNGDAATIRAVTLLGGTGKAHIWKYDPTTNSWN